MEKAYIAIDLKSFYASVECGDRHLDPLNTHLVVADPGRTEKTICLAVSPSLKALGISGRARLFEVVQRVREVNAQRFRTARKSGLLAKDPRTGQFAFAGASSDAAALAGNPALETAYIVAPPRMKRYEEVSTKIYSVYLRFVSSEDIHVYSIDECFIDVTGYLKTYGLTPREMAVRMIREVLKETGITATAGIGTNLYLAKVAMDIVAKHVPADQDGVRIAELTERSYREKLWCHQPLTDFWRVGKGIARRLEALGCHTMGDVARLSLTGEDYLYQSMGVNAELLIDHAWGWEPTEIADIKAFRPETKSISSGQVLAEPYDAEKTRLIVQEMTELLALDLVKKGMVTRQVTLTVYYDRDSLIPVSPGEDTAYQVRKTGRRFTGTVVNDYYGRPAPKPAHGTGNMGSWTASAARIRKTMMALFDRIIDPDLLTRRIYVTAENLIPENEIPAEEPEQLDLFTDYAALERRKAAEAETDEKEKRLQKAALLIQGKFGKNAMLKGFNLREGATTRQRNLLIGGHSAENSSEDLPAGGSEKRKEGDEA